MNNRDYTTRQLKTATIHTIVHYTDWPEIREYEVSDNEELANLLMEMRNPEHGEWVVDVEADYE